MKYIGIKHRFSKLRIRCHKSRDFFSKIPRAFSVIEALVGTAVMGAGLLAVAAALNYSSSHYGKLQGSSASILAHTEVLKNLQPSAAAPLVSLCDQIKFDSDKTLLGRTVDEIKSWKEGEAGALQISSLELRSETNGNMPGLMYHVGHRAPPNYDVTVRDIRPESFYNVQDDLSIKTCPYTTESRSTQHCSSLPKQFKLYRLNLDIVTSREKSESDKVDKTITAQQEARIYTPLKIPLLVYIYDQKIVSCGLSKTLHSCKQGSHFQSQELLGRLKVKGNLGSPASGTFDLACDFGLPAIRSQAQGARPGLRSTDYCIAGPLFAVQGVDGQPGACLEPPFGAPRHGAEVCKQVARTCAQKCPEDIVGKDFYVRKMMEYAHGGVTLELFHCVKCVNEDGVPVEPKQTGRTNLSARDAIRILNSCIENAPQPNTPPTGAWDRMGSGGLIDIERHCRGYEECEKAVEQCARAAGPQVVQLLGFSFFSVPCKLACTGENTVNCCQAGDTDCCQCPSATEKDHTCDATPGQVAQMCIHDLEGCDSGDAGSTEEPDGAETSTVFANTDGTACGSENLPCELLRQCTRVTGDDVSWPRSTVFSDFGFVRQPAAEQQQQQKAEAAKFSCYDGSIEYLVKRPLVAERMSKEDVCVRDTSSPQFYYHYSDGPNRRLPQWPTPHRSNNPEYLKEHHIQNNESALEVANGLDRSYSCACYVDERDASNSSLWKLNLDEDQAHRLKGYTKGQLPLPSPVTLRNRLFCDGMQQLDVFVRELGQDPRFRAKELGYPHLTARLYDFPQAVDTFYMQCLQDLDLLNTQDMDSGTSGNQPLHPNSCQQLKNEVYSSNGRQINDPPPLQLAGKTKGDAVNTQLKFKDKECGCTSSDLDCCCSSPPEEDCSCTLYKNKNAADIQVQSGDFRDRKHPEPDSFANRICQGPCDCGLKDRQHQKDNEWQNNPWIEGDGGYTKWCSALKSKIVNYMKTNELKDLPQESMQPHHNVALDSLQTQAEELYTKVDNDVAAGNWWKWWSVYKCEKEKYSRPVYRYSFMCKSDKMETEKLIEKANGTCTTKDSMFTCCLDWAKAYDADNNVIQTNEEPAQGAGHKNNDLNTPSYYQGPFDANECLKEHRGSSASYTRPGRGGNSASTGGGSSQGGGSGTGNSNTASTGSNSGSSSNSAPGGGGGGYTSASR